MSDYTEHELIAEVKRGERDCYRIRICEYKGHRYVDLRQWYLHRGTNEYAPGKGCTIKPESLREVILALQRALQLIDKVGG